jgi:hypothetical protein
MDDDVLSKFEEDYRPLRGVDGDHTVLDALLKQPARIVYEIVEGHAGRNTAALVILSLLCIVGYGIVMATFSGGHQLWAVPAKLAVGLLLCALICLPSLYIFASLAGATRTFRETAGLLTAAIALGSLLLAGFAPVVWIFSQSTDTVVFMGILHLLFGCVGVHFTLRLLNRSLAFLSGRRMRILRIWGVIFICVVLQMATTLRPLIGEYAGFRLEGKKFFLAHWFDAREKTHGR